MLPPHHLQRDQSLIMSGINTLSLKSSSVIPIANMVDSDRPLFIGESIHSIMMPDLVPVSASASVSSSISTSSTTFMTSGSTHTDTSTSTTTALSEQQGNQNAVEFSPEEALLKLTNRTQYPIVQENGQRCYGPPPDWMEPSPERGCEVFVGRIPRDCFEDELVPIFETIGPIYMFRLMMDFNGCNRGYGFCMFFSREHAKQAVKRLDNFEIRADKMLGVCQSVDNCRLFVGGIPKSKTREEIFTEMAKVTEGVRDVIVYPSAADKSKNRGFAFVEYESHKAAAMARRKLIPGRIQLWGQMIAVDWAEPEREVDENIMATVRVLYVRNLMLSTSEDTLRDIFSEACEAPDTIERVKKMRDYAFIHFRERKHAELSMKKLHNTYVEGSRVEVSWAKPVDKSESGARNVGAKCKSPNLASMPPTNSLVSMPMYFDPMMYPGMYNTTPTASTLGWNMTPSPSRLNLSGRTNRVYRNAAGSRSAGSRNVNQNNFREKKSTEVLEEVCQKNNWGQPAFSVTSQEIFDASSGQQITCYLGQVFIIGQNQQYMAPTLAITPEDAKQTVARSVLSLFNIQLQIQTLEPSSVPLTACPNNMGVCYVNGTNSHYPSPTLMNDNLTYSGSNMYYLPNGVAPASSQPPQLSPMHKNKINDSSVLGAFLSMKDMPCHPSEFIGACGDAQAVPPTNNADPIMSCLYARTVNYQAAAMSMLQPMGDSSQMYYDPNNITLMTNYMPSLVTGNDLYISTAGAYQTLPPTQQHHA